MTGISIVLSHAPSLLFSAVMLYAGEDFLAGLLIGAAVRNIIVEQRKLEAKREDEKVHPPLAEQWRCVACDKLSTGMGACHHCGSNAC